MDSKKEKIEMTGYIIPYQDNGNMVNLKVVGVFVGHHVAAKDIYSR